MRFVILLMSCWMMIGFMPDVAADEIIISDVQGHIDGDFYYVDADLRIELSPDAADAVESGVPLQFAFDFEVLRPRRLLWDRRVLSLRRSFRLERHALANRYVVTDLVTRQRTVHTSMEDALTALGHVSAVTLGTRATFFETAGLHGRLQAQLDIEALPAPLRPVAYLSPSWHLKSDWYTWELTP